MKITHKLIIWSSSLCLVITTLFFDINFDFSKTIRSDKNYSHTIDTEPMFKLIDVVTIKPNTEIFEEVEASLLLTVMGYVALSVFLSLGAHYTSEFVRANASMFTDWYVNWYNSVPTLEGGQTAQEISQWKKAQEIPQYLKETGQLNNDGTLKNNQVVLKNDYLGSIYESANWYLNDYVDAGGVKWNYFKYEANSPYSYGYFPDIQGESSVKFGQSYLQLNYSNTAYMLNTTNYSYEITVVNINSSTSRLKLVVKNKSNNSIEATRYTRDLTVEETAIYNQNVGNLISLIEQSNPLRWNFQMTPLHWASNITNTMNRTVIFEYTSLTSTYAEGLMWKANYGYLNSNFSGSNSETIIFEDNFPVNSSIKDDPYLIIPVITNPNTNSNIPPIVPLPTEQIPDYEYNPPTPGTGDIDIDWSDLTNPDISAPTATPENTISGGIFQMLGDWIVSTFFGAINAIMGFWEAFVNGLFSLLNGIKDALLVPLVAMQQGIDVIKEAHLPGIDPVIGLAQFIIDTLTGIINILMLLVTSVISAVVSFFNLISSLLNILPVQIRPIFQFILGTLSMMIIIKLFGLVFGFIGQIVGVVK